MPFPLLAIPAIMGAAALASHAAGSSRDRYGKEQKRRLGELDKDLASGVGLSEAEKAGMQTAAMAPVRSQTGSMASELARAQAASGGIGGGVGAAAARDSMARATGLAAERIGARVGAADLDALGAKRQEREDIMAARSQRRKEAWEGTTRIFTSVGNMYGGMLGGPKNAVNAGGSGGAPQQAPAEANERAAEANERAAEANERADSEAIGMTARNSANDSMARQAALRQRYQALISQGYTPEAAAAQLGV